MFTNASVPLIDGACSYGNVLFICFFIGEISIVPLVDVIDAICVGDRFCIGNYVHGVDVVGDGWCWSKRTLVLIVAIEVGQEVDSGVLVRITKLEFMIGIGIKKGLVGLVFCLLVDNAAIVYVFATSIFATHKNKVNAKKNVDWILKLQLKYEVANMLLF